MKFKPHRQWHNYPVGTKAFAIGGGFWIRTEDGWRWHCGDTFPGPGPDAYEVEMPVGDGIHLTTELEAFAVQVQRDWLNHWKDRGDHRYAKDYAAFLGERLITDFRLPGKPPV
jgi:hypothetical protein